MTEDDHNALARDLSIAMLDALPLEDMDANDVAAVVAKAGLGVLMEIRGFSFDEMAEYIRTTTDAVERWGAPIH